MNKMTIGANNTPIANGKTTTFGFKYDCTSHLNGEAV
jgi:hypothetical protein